jgi:hypothetical protein
MEEKILIGRDRRIVDLPQATWKEHLAQIPQHSQPRLSFMTPAHHKVRYFVVNELVKQQKPLAPELIASTLGMSLTQVTGILEELEQKLFFLVRNEQGSVTWAYPVTVEPTPHRLNFSTGERLYGA